MIAYHFCGDTLRDGRPIPADGEWLEHTGEVEICETGLHASLHPYDMTSRDPDILVFRTALIAACVVLTLILTGGIPIGPQ